MRKSNNYYKFMEYVSDGKRHDNTICKDNGVLECTSYCTVSDIEYYENTTLGVENDWLTIKNVLVNKEVIYVYYVKGERTFYIEQFVLDIFKTQRDLKNAIHKAVDKFFINNVDILKDKEPSAPEATSEPEAPEATEGPEATEEPEATEATEEPEATEAAEELEALEAAEGPEETTEHNTNNEKWYIYLSVYRDLQQSLTHLRKCKTPRTYDICVGRYIRKLRKIHAEKKISKSMLHFIESKISMQNAECGIWPSEYESATGYHKSRRYNKNRVDE